MTRFSERPCAKKIRSEIDPMGAISDRIGNMSRISSLQERRAQLSASMLLRRTVLLQPRWNFLYGWSFLSRCVGCSGSIAQRVLLRTASTGGSDLARLQLFALLAI